MDKYNLDKLIKVRSFDFQYEPFVTFKEGRKKSFWKSEIKRGFYSFGVFDEKYLGETLPEKYFLHYDSGIYEKPRVDLIFQNNMSKTIYFDSLKAADNYLRDLTNTRNWI